MKHTLTLALLLLLATAAHADRVRVRIYSNNTVSNINISFDLGAYNLYADGNRLVEDMITEGRSVTIQPQAGKLRLRVGETDYGTVSTLRLEATDTACILCLNPDGAKQRTYEGDLEISPAKNGSLLIINDVEFETYIAGVVQSEIYGKQTDIFRIQAIISRTWALRNSTKHRPEGYNFCDHVHCQAYLNRCIRPDIMMGAIQSSGETLVDSDGKLIETPFHSNSGGQTANSEDVWRTALPYLRSVQDTFSFHMRQSDWTKTVSIDRWLNYFATKHKLNTKDPAIRDSLLHFTQTERKKRLLGVPLTRIRVDFQLKSTFFSVQVDSSSNNIVIHGHGYGHGVGLSQEGAIRMVGLGISYDSILRHYYTGAVLHHDPSANRNYVENYVTQIARIIEEDKHKQTQTRSKKDDWLGRLFRLRDREEREEIYVESEQENDKDWQYEW
ncbi:MAG: SpoIID/LytB domain-containing protein [Bacteroidales bacterium]|nr:SpoIID/LytB domain-containing protein [Bacteroidales bacterium]